MKDLVKILYDMMIGDKQDYDEYNILRVPGGWIFRERESIPGIMITNTFVPYIDKANPHI